MRQTLLVASYLSGALILGCGGPDVGDDTTSTQTGATPMSDGMSETGAGESTSGAPTTGAVPTTSPITSTGDDTTDSGFITKPDGGGPAECDSWEQDCPEGQKCAPWAEGGGSAWNALKCVPVTGDQQPGEPCTAEGGGVSGLDDCIKGAMCWDVDEQGHGVCVAHCIGSPEQPACPEPGFGCPIVSEGVLNICLPTCDPLIQDCAAGDLCLPVSGSYFCVLDWSRDAGAVFDPCEFANACDLGLVCLGSAAASECDQMKTGCCLPMCSIAAGGEVCPGVGQACLAVYEPQPPGFEDVGLCSLNM